jgi:hypothetical protein
MNDDKHQIANEVERLKRVLDNPSTEGDTLKYIHRRLCLINARRTIDANGNQDRDLTFATDFVNHASFMWDQRPRGNWILQVQASIKMLERLIRIEKENDMN